MIMYDIFTGEFVSRGDGSRITVTIMQELDAAPADVGVLQFPGREPLLIEWVETSKEDVICGSTAVLKILSPGDRTYAGLYTITPGSIGLRVERDGQMYWMGTLDPEFYEEPYTSNEDYEVELTFSDFGIFERLQYNLVGMQPLGDILKDALTRARIYEAIDQTLISTQLTSDGGKMSLNDLCIRSENFTDEDGETSNMQEVVTGVLQPLGLRMIQRCGRVWVYDLNGIYAGAGTEKVEWHDADQMMGVDKVANNVKITFSPYAASEMTSDSVEFEGEYSVEDINLTAAPGADYYSYYPDYGDEHRQGNSWDYDLIDFTIFLSTKGNGLAYLNPSARYFHILPVVGSAPETDGVAWSFYSGGHGALAESHHWPKQILNAMGHAWNRTVMRTNRVYIPKISADEAKKYYIRLSLEMLLDARYNPFTDGTNKGNEAGNYDDFKEFTGWAFVPVGVTIFDAGGNALLHYVNSPIANSASVGHLGYARGKWEGGAANFGDAWLEYYDPEDLNHNAGILGWKTNRHCIGRPDNEKRRNSAYCGRYSMPTIFDSFKQMPDGEYMPYPEQGGYLEVTVYEGVNCYDYNETKWIGVPITELTSTEQWDKRGLYEKTRWLLYKAPKVELVRNNLTFSKEELNDVEYNGYINRDAKDEITIDTICGTIDKPAPTARGVYFQTSNEDQVMQLTRQGRTDLVEKLLIGTLYSQFADRHTRLSGTVFLLDGPLRLYKDGMQGEKRFIMLADLQDLDAGTSEATIVELSPDEYESIEYKETT